MRRKLFGLTVLFLLASVAGFGLRQPIPANLARYIWWSNSHHANLAAVDIDGVQIRYAVYGQGRPVVLLHGGLSNRRAWFSQIPYLVDSGHRVIAIDSRGHGGSGLGTQPLSYRQMAFDVSRILQQEKIKAADIIGWSDGANTALVLARDWPEYVKRIVAISANFDPSGLDEATQAESLKLRDGLDYWLLRWLSGAGRVTRTLERHVKNMWLNDPIISPQQLNRITSPVLVIVGANDIITASHTRQLVALLPHAELRIIANAGHASLITHATQVNAAIQRFLDPAKG